MSGGYKLPSAWAPKFSSQPHTSLVVFSLPRPFPFPPPLLPGLCYITEALFAYTTTTTTDCRFIIFFSHRLVLINLISFTQLCLTKISRPGRKREIYFTISLWSFPFISTILKQAINVFSRPGRGNTSFWFSLFYVSQLWQSSCWFSSWHYWCISFLATENLGIIISFFSTPWEDLFWKRILGGRDILGRMSSPLQTE